MLCSTKVLFATRKEANVIIMGIPGRALIVEGTEAMACKVGFHFVADGLCGGSLVNLVRTLWATYIISFVTFVA